MSIKFRISRFCQILSSTKKAKKYNLPQGNDCRLPFFHDYIYYFFTFLYLNGASGVPISGYPGKFRRLSNHILILSFTTDDIIEFTSTISKTRSEDQEHYDSRRRGKYGKKT